MRGAAGAVAAASWAAGEPILQRLVRSPYSDVRLLGRLVTRGRGWPVAGVVVHAANAALWPAMALVDRIHPDRRAGTWPPLARNPRIAVYELLAHALFGAVLGALVRR